MSLISDDAIITALKVPQHVRKGRVTLFYPADFALVAVRSNTHQVAHFNSPDYRALRFSLLPLEPDMTFYFLIDLVCIYGAPRGSHGRKKNRCGKPYERICKLC